MTEQHPIEYEPSVASDLEPAAGKEFQTPLAWFEIESSTYGEFKQGQFSMHFLYLFFKEPTNSVSCLANSRQSPLLQGADHHYRKRCKCMVSNIGLSPQIEPHSVSLTIQQPPVPVQGRLGGALRDLLGPLRRTHQLPTTDLCSRLPVQFRDVCQWPADR